MQLLIYIYTGLFPRLIHVSGDIEMNQGSKKDLHNFTKVTLLKAYLSVQRFDIFHMPETYLNLLGIRQKGKSQITHACAYQGVRNVCFSEILTCFAFLKHPF